MSENEDFKIFIAETRIYRKTQYEKLEELKCDIKAMKEKIDEFPCVEQSITLKTVKAQLKYIWGFISATMLLIIGTYLKERK